ncbi:hypothetical protein AAFC00_006049 [Neodothiora populina]|uniref:Protein YOP1 n=1 Tax=Neodothiora populina TaxID=2781224 RepID=A0ABR3P730_9PEZI
MFGIVADLLTTVTSVCFPVYASYKALRTSDPAQLTPWLMYWTTLSLFMATESFFHPIISWFPFYSWIRFGTHLYLVMPGQQGSVYLYQTYIHPFLAHHEREIDSGIAQSHERAKQAGLQYLKQAIEWARVNVLGLQPRRPTPPPSRNVSYTSSLLSRFNMPAARDGLASAGAGDLFSLLGSAMQQATGAGAASDSSARSAQAHDLAASGNLIPAHLSNAEKMEFVFAQRDRLRTLLQAFESEDITQPVSGSSSSNSGGRRTPENTPPMRGSPFMRQNAPSDMQKSRSEAEFEDLAYEDVPSSAAMGDSASQHRVPSSNNLPPTQRQASWSKWVWGNYGEKDSVLEAKKDE